MKTNITLIAGRLFLTIAIVYILLQCYNWFGVREYLFSFLVIGACAVAIKTKQWIKEKW